MRGWLKWIFGRPGREASGRVRNEVDEELDFHLEMRALDNERAGMDPAAARRAARDRFGPRRRIARQSRSERLAAIGSIHGTDPARRSPLVGFVDGLRQDAAYALRAFARSPGFLAAAVLTLALGLGATTTIYGLAHWVLLRPVPGVEDPEELSLVWVGRRGPDGSSFRPDFLSYPNYRDVTARLTTLSGMAGQQSARLAVATGGGPARHVGGQVVTTSYFVVLGVVPRLGRTFTDAEHDPSGGASVVIIGHRLWTSAFHRDPEVLGKTIRLNGQLFSIVGVLPEGFQGTERLSERDVWLPSSAYARIRHFDDPGRFARRESGFFYELIARLAPGATWEQVEAELASLGGWLAEQYPQVNEGFGDEIGFHVMGPIGQPAMGREYVATTVALLMGVAALVLLIACANVANLLLIRGLGRQDELAVRRALGAGRGRLVRQRLTEGVVLWLLGGGVGVLVATWLTRLFAGARIGFATLEGVPIEGRAVAFAAVLSVAVGTVFAVLPALSTSKVDPAASLKAAPTASRPRLRLRTLLTVVQLSASLTLLVGALLLARSLANLAAVDLGFDPSGVTIVRVSPDQLGYSQQEVFEYWREFERRLAARPEIAAISIVYQVPTTCCGWRTVMRHPGRPSDDALLEPYANVVIAPGFFDVLGIPLLRGRGFSGDDLAPPGVEARRVVVLSESLARQLFGDIDVVGRFVEYAGRSRAGKQYRVIGVAADVHYAGPGTAAEPMVYEPTGLDGFLLPAAAILVRTAAPLEIDAVAREIAASIDAALPISEVVPLTLSVEAVLSQSRLLARFIGLLAALAGLLAAVGLYGVVAFAVDARRRELGIRIALGAAPRSVFGLVMGTTLGVTAAGLVVGLASALGLARFLQSRLYEVGPFDPLVWSVAAVALVAIALLAALLPARRATRLDPVRTLRSL